MNDPETHVKQNNFFCWFFKAKISKEQCRNMRVKTSLSKKRAVWGINASTMIPCSKDCERHEIPTARETKETKKAMMFKTFKELKKWREKRSRDKKGRKFNVKRDEKICDLLKQGKTPQDLGLLFDLTPTRINQIREEV